jgi:predicted metal-dependent HD superfamily phosphohydrolase
MQLDSSAVQASQSFPLTRARFFQLWRKYFIGTDSSKAGTVWNTLERYYSQDHRHYHNFAHIAHCLSQHDLAAGAMETPDAVEMAIWFHDVIYEPQATDNESRSADLFRHFGSSGFSQAFVVRVRDLILATVHDDPPLHLDQKYIVDIDLSSFGLPWHEYLRDTNAIRRENCTTPEDVHYPAMLKFLRALLNRPRIFLTDFFYRRYEHTARANIGRYLGLVESNHNRAL